MRVSKKHDVRLNEILDISENLFATKGYEKTTVNDILDGVGIGKGTFYHYFKSKDEVMDAVIMRMANTAKAASQAIADMPGLSANEKLAKVFADQPGYNGAIVEQLHHDDNSAMHLKSLIEAMLAVTPAVTQIVKQGISEGVYNTPYPQESFEILFTGAQFLFDPGLFAWSAEELRQKITAFVHIMEIVLGAKKGCFDFFYMMDETSRRLGTTQQKE